MKETEEEEDPLPVAEEPDEEQEQKEKVLLAFVSNFKTQQTFGGTKKIKSMLKLEME